MDDATRKTIIQTIIERERLRPMGRIERLIKGPLRTIPYYGLAALGHLRPFQMRFKTLWGTRMTSYLPEGNTFLYYGYCEANLANFFLRYAREGFLFIDVGAHVGYYSILLSELVGPSGNVHSFEPTPWTFTILTTNTHLLKNVTINNIAVGDSDQELEFADYGPGYGAYNTAHSEGASSLSVQPTMTRVKSTTLDAYCATIGRTPDIVKIDAEGFEFPVLSGMKHILGKSTTARPLISLEVAGGEEWHENRTKSFEFLKEQDYEAYEIEVTGLLKKHATKNSYTYDNLIFVPRERLGEIKDLEA